MTEQQQPTTQHIPVAFADLDVPLVLLVRRLNDGKTMQQRVEDVRWKRWARAKAMAARGKRGEDEVI